MSDVTNERIDAEAQKAVDAIAASDLAALIPHMDRLGLTGDLDTVIRTARPNAKVQRRFMPANVQGDILKAALRHAKARELVQDTVVGFYYDELGDDVADPTLDQLTKATDAVLAKTSASLVTFTLLGVVARGEVAAPHAITVLKNRFSVDLTK